MPTAALHACSQHAVKNPDRVCRAFVPLVFSNHIVLLLSHSKHWLEVRTAQVQVEDFTVIRVSPKVYNKDMRQGHRLQQHTGENSPERNVAMHREKMIRLHTTVV